MGVHTCMSTHEHASVFMCMCVGRCMCVQVPEALEPEKLGILLGTELLSSGKATYALNN